jgi:hypothetical protein
LFPDILDDALTLLGHLDLDEFFEYMISSADAVSKRGITAKQLSKVWSIEMLPKGRLMQPLNCVFARKVMH